MATRAPVLEKKLTPKMDALFGEWFTAVEQLAAAKSKESELRAKILEFYYPEGVSHVGTQNWQLPGGFLFKVEGKMNAKVDETQLQSVRDKLKALGPDEETGEIYAVETAIKYKAEVSMTGFKSLSQAAQKIMCEAVTFTPGSPTVAMVQPKQTAAPKATAAAGFNPFAEA